MVLTALAEFLFFFLIFSLGIVYNIVHSFDTVIINASFNHHDYSNCEHSPNRSFTVGDNDSHRKKNKTSVPKKLIFVKTH